MEFGVYFHVPFCRVQCPYCTFYTVLRPAADDRGWRFAAALFREWELRVVPRLERGDRLATLTKTGTDSKKKTGTKPQVKFRDDNEEKKEGAFAYLVLKASKSTTINVSINESEAGKIKAGMSKRVPLHNTDEMRISLSDGQGTQYDTSFVVQDKDAGRNIVITFPEVDYTPVKDDQLHQEKPEELRRIKEAQEALKQQHIASLNEAQGRIRDWIKLIFNDKTALQTLIIKIRKGESGITDQVLKSRDLFLNDKNQLASLVKNYSDSAVAFTMKDERVSSSASSSSSEWSSPCRA